MRLESKQSLDDQRLNVLASQPLEIQDLSLSTPALFCQVWGHLTRSRRIQLTLLMVVMLASGVAELVSLGAVLPFLGMLSDPETLWQQPLTRWLANQLGFTHASQLLLPITLAFAATSVITALIRLLNLWLNGRLAAAVGSDLSCEAYRRTLHQPYGVHLQRSSGSVITSITTHTDQTVAALGALLQLITCAAVAASLFTGLLLIDTPIAFAAAGLFGSFYFVLAMLSRQELLRNGQKLVRASTLQLKALQEGLGAIREVLLDCSQETYLQSYRQANRDQRKLVAKNIFLSSFPRYIFEALGMVVIALIGGLVVLQRGSGNAVIPLLGALALGAQRLLPALQNIYSSWASLKSFSAAIQTVLAMLSQPCPAQVSVNDSIKLKESICLSCVSFSYGPEHPQVLQGLDLEIRRGERIGLIGSTGSGKSTTVDLLMGLLPPTAGFLLVDGDDVHDHKYPERLPSWRAQVVHVPQSIYLSDSSIAENIAFGVPKHQINLARVKEAAEKAQIAGFIEDSPQGYNALVGERGIRLSGGQRQRIGIARALYKNAQVIVLDEATSALDTNTESLVMNAVDGLDKQLTVIIVAHRLTTLQNCDKIYRIQNGFITGYCLPRDLLE